MADTKLIRGSDGSGEAVRATVTSARSVASTTLAVDAITNWPTNFIATVGTLGADGFLTASTVQVFEGHLSGSNIIIDTFSPGYTDLGNSIGDVVILKPTTPWADNLADTLEVSHNEDGTLKDEIVTPANIDYPTFVEAIDTTTTSAITSGAAIKSINITQTGTYLITYHWPVTITHNASHNGRLTMHFGNNPNTETHPRLTSHYTLALTTGGTGNQSAPTLTATAIVPITATGTYSLWANNISNSAVSACGTGSSQSTGLIQATLISSATA